MLSRQVFKIPWCFQKSFLCCWTQTSHFDAWTYSRINSGMGMTRSASSLSLTFKLHKTMCAFILVNHLVHSHVLPGVHRKSSMSKMSGAASVGNLSTSKLYWLNSICYWKCSTCKAFFTSGRNLHSRWLPQVTDGNTSSLSKEQVLFLQHKILRCVFQLLQWPDAFLFIS